MPDKSRPFPCEADNTCPYLTVPNPERDIEGMPLIVGDARSCPLCEHACPVFMEDYDLTVEELRIRSITHRCLGRLVDNPKVVDDPEWKSLHYQYGINLLKYPPSDYPQYYDRMFRE